MILDSDETYIAGTHLIRRIKPFYRLEAHVELKVIDPDPDRPHLAGLYCLSGELSRHRIEVVAGRRLSSTTVSTIAHELCHAWQAERWPDFYERYGVPRGAASRAVYFANPYERQARVAAHRITSYLLKDLETDTELAELCGLKWRNE